MKTAIFVFLLACTALAQDSILFIIRVDDVQSRGTQSPRSILTFQQAVERRGGKVTWAVIPHRLIETQNTDGTLARELKQSRLAGHEIAMHGYNHTCPVDASTGHEMYCASRSQGIPLVQQQTLLQDGIKILQDSVGYTPTSFVPPGHAQDTNTFRALVSKGFSWISSVGGTRKYLISGLYNLQQNNEYTWSLTSANYALQLTAALTDIANTAPANGYYCLLLHDPFIRQGYENGIVIQWIGALLDSLNARYGSRVRYRTLTQAAQSFRDLPVAVNETGSVHPGNFTLSHAYPNPFNPSVTVKYTLNGETAVELAVYNMLGGLVAVLAHGSMPPGEYTAHWDAGSYPSGVYLLVLRSGAQRQSIKVMLEK